jgi:acetyltransferase-like isoleucine patch superfamily enzyme
MKAMLRKWKNAVFAKWALRQCTSVGISPHCRSFPLIENQGTLVAGNDFDIWSHLIRSQLSVGLGGTLTIGNNVFINVGVSISAQSQVTLGNNVQIANLVSIMDSDFHGLEERDSLPSPEPIYIEDDVWIATKATILKGVTIGKGAVVAAHAVVTHDVEPYTLVGGVPARLIRRLNRPDSSPVVTQVSQRP